MPRRTVTIVTCSLCDAASDDESLYTAATLALGSTSYEFDLCQSCLATDARVTGLADHGIRVRNGRAPKAPAVVYGDGGKEPCPECSRLYVPGFGMARHRQLIHGVPSGTAQRRAEKEARDAKAKRARR